VAVNVISPEGRVAVSFIYIPYLAKTSMLLNIIRGIVKVMNNMNDVNIKLSAHLRLNAQQITLAIIGTKGKKIRMANNIVNPT
jgi:hypothetical protein